MTGGPPEWESVYAAIRADFGFDRAADERARDVLGALLSDSDPLDGLPTIANRAVAIVAPGPSLPSALGAGERISSRTTAGSQRSAGSGSAATDIATADCVIAVSDAAATLREHGLRIDCHVTDLDGAPLVARELSREGVPVVVHGHGDNAPALRRHVPRMRGDRVYPTAQVPPAGPVHSPGGFTDGDRAAVLADRCGASELRFVGWDLDDPTLDPIKRRKLRWAARILAWLERRRGERYAVLDGRRASLAPLPFE